jgi:hypothetical protein
MAVNEPAANGQEMPDIVLAAGVLATSEVSFLLVGSAALWLRGEPIPVGDVDAVIEPGEANLRRLREALVALAIKPGSVPGLGRLREIHITSTVTAYGKIDCLLERGRRDWDRLRRNAGYIAIADVPVLVASAPDAWALRHRFKS